MRRYRFQLVLAAESGLSHDEAIRALRAALKSLGRSYGFKCVDAVEVKPPDDTQPPTDATGSPTHAYCPPGGCQHCTKPPPPDNSDPRV